MEPRKTPFVGFFEMACGQYCRWLHVLGLLVWSAAAQAIPAGAALEFDSPEREKLYRELLHELRCTVCQNQALVDSNAPLAHDLRRHAYRMVQAGHDRDEIVTFMVDRYGDFVLCRPPFRDDTLLLWFGPLIIFLLGALLVFRVLRMYRPADDEAEIAQTGVTMPRERQQTNREGE